VEVGRVAQVLLAMAIYDWAPSIPVVSLCPNHHAYYHHAIRRVKNEKSHELSEALDEELSERDWDRLIEIDAQRIEAQDRVRKEVREDFLPHAKKSITGRSRRNE
jgi:hypothetical protein